MVNVFKVKRWGSFLLAAFLPTIMFFVALLTFGFFYAMVFFLAGAIISVVLGGLLIRHPLLSMAEGAGLGIFTFDSTGLIRPFIAKVQAPYINSRLGNKNFSSVFDRNTVNYLAPIKEARMEETDTEIVLRLPKAEYSEKLFNFAGAFPVLLWNSVLGEFYTKDMLAKLETETFVQHLVLYLNRKTDELSNSVRDFARYIVEQTRPKTNFFQSKLFWIVVIIVLVLVLLAFAPQIMKTFGTIELPAAPVVPVSPR